MSFIITTGSFSSSSSSSSCSFSFDLVIKSFPFSVALLINSLIENPVNKHAPITINKIDIICVPDTAKSDLNNTAKEQPINPPPGEVKLLPFWIKSKVLDKSLNVASYTFTKSPVTSVI